MKQGLYLISPAARFSADALIKAVRETAKTRDVDAFLYAFPEEMNREEHCAVLKKLIPALQSDNIAVLLKDDVETALKTGCDGVQVAYAPALSKLRKRMPDIAMGVVCATRHEAMTAGEAGADYIAFTGENAAENTEWWSELFNVPCVSLPSETPCPAADFIAETVRLQATGIH